VSQPDLGTDTIEQLRRTRHQSRPPDDDAIVVSRRQETYDTRRRVVQTRMSQE